MGTAFIVFKQTCVMFLYMFAGYVLFKSEKLTIKGSRDIGSLLIYLVIPSVIIKSFCTEYSHVMLLKLLQSAFISALALGLAMAIAAFIFKKDPIANFGSAFSNAGFIGIPLIQAALGDGGVFYIVSIVAMLNMLQWSYGVSVITGEKSAVSLRHLVMNPILIGILIGLVLFVTGIGSRLPDVVASTLSGISSLNAPLAMILLGSYLAQSDIKKMFISPHLYWVSAVRLIIIPLVTLLVFSFIPLESDMMLAVFISAAAPIGANVAIYAQLYDRDYPYACQTVAHSTLLSIVTLPLLLMLADVLL